MPVNYESQQYFYGKEKEYDRFELMKMWAEIPQNKRNIDMLFNLTGIPKYHLKELKKVDKWDEEAAKEDKFKMIAKRNEVMMTSEETRQQFLEQKYSANRKLFETAMQIASSDALQDKLLKLSGEVKNLRDLQQLMQIIFKVQEAYAEDVGEGKAKNVKLTQNNYYDMRDQVRDRIFAGEIIVDEE